MNALVVVDVQNYFVNEKTRHLPQKIADFIRNNKYDYVLFTRFVNNEDSNHFKHLGWEKCRTAPETDIHPVLQEFVGETNVFAKAGYSIFKCSEFAQFLKKKKIQKLFLCGLDIDSCILASAFDGFDLGYEMHILKDLSSSHSGEELQNSALKIIEECFERK